MEGLRQISQKIFDENQRFNKASHSQTFETLLLSQHKDGSSKIHRHYIVESELVTWTGLANVDVEATLRLVCLTSEPDTSLNVSRDVFSSILYNLKVDISMLYMICHVKDGFHYFPGDSTGFESFLPTWFVGTSRYTVVWTFDAKRSSISGIVIERQPNTWLSFIDALEKFNACIQAPQVMCFAITSYQMHFYDGKLEAALNDLRRIEKIIGFGPRKGPGYRHGVKDMHPARKANLSTFAVDEIFVHSQKVHEVAGKIKNSDRHRRICARLLDDILAANRTVIEHSIEIRDERRKKYRLALQKLSEAVPVLQQQIDANTEYLSYMRYRAENLSQVIIALLTHEDASATIDLAAASRKDTSSMKTIAIMTMIFLPATFFAAFFSLPLLQWDQPRLFHNSFWVYWAFTIPSTAAVFGVWHATSLVNWNFFKIGSVSK
ncbi:hypothetical protein FB567DRAFT_51293 [Paraphoma chrysanthemicola]|uniref:Uncharacterized protein n=1 Tax=Paraphoma chrysanthemicola TaxID=798071 RepID=A0A8K0R7B0_9PLEO|nr:hypothetical protein FB567DRAFT_51293 [Paraphoma chrysanthemicola]